MSRLAQAAAEALAKKRAADKAWRARLVATVDAEIRNLVITTFGDHLGDDIDIRVDWTSGVGGIENDGLIGITAGDAMVTVEGIPFWVRFHDRRHGSKHTLYLTNYRMTVPEGTDVADHHAGWQRASQYVSLEQVGTALENGLIEVREPVA